uniref:Uncharacterized protein n=1 Tax=Pyrodinium bahamense TaxID=73915 RepID=A0A7S0A051_9DINO
MTGHQGRPNQGDHNPTPQACVDGGPCGIAHLCFEPEGAMTNEEWTYVGAGKGQYSKMQTYEYVGDGAGTFHKEVERGDPGKTVKHMCQGFIAVLVVAGIIAVIYTILAGPKDEDIQANLGPQVANATTAMGTMATEPVQPVRLSDSNADAQPYDCEEGYFNWDKAWSNQKKHYCCDTYGRGCPAVAGAAVAGAQPTTTGEFVQYNCEDDGHKSWIKDWPVEKQAWCCKHRNTGCLRDDDALMEQNEASAREELKQTQEPKKYDCNRGGDPWRDHWPVNKRVYCCLNFKVGCPSTSTVPGLPAHVAKSVTSTPFLKTPASSAPSLKTVAPAASAGCSAPCPASSPDSKTCKHQILYLATHKFAHQQNACASAHAKVLDTCSSCAGCSLAASGCAAAVPLAAAAPPSAAAV